MDVYTSKAEEGMSKTNHVSFDETSSSKLGSENSTTSFTSELESSDIVPADRLLKIKERNRMHARETRKRKKAHTMLALEKYNKLKDEQVRLKQELSDLKTANIMLSMSAGSLGMKLNAFDSTTSKPKTEVFLTCSSNPSSSDETSGTFECKSDAPSSGTFECSDAPNKKVKFDLTSETQYSQNKPQGNSRYDHQDTKFGESEHMHRYEEDSGGNGFSETKDESRREQNRLRSKKARADCKQALNKLEMSISKFEEDNRRLRSSVHKLRNQFVVIPAAILPSSFA